MSNSKISALTSASTPLAGTEVLPIVQSSATKQVSVANLTAGRSVSVADITASTGNFIVGTAGKGVDFSVVTHAGSTSKLLADYEVGTWTATITDGTTSVSGSTGWYIKIGKQVTCGAGFYDKNISGLSAAGLRLGGLPFSNNGTYGAPNTIVCTLSSNYPVAAIVSGSNTYADLYAGTSGANLNGVTKASFADAVHASVQATITYYTT